MRNSFFTPKSLVTSIFVLFFTTNIAIAEDNRTQKISKSLSTFNSVLKQVDAYYVDSLNYEKMVKAGIDAMLGELDPYTVYIPEEELSDITYMTTGEYGGIGALIGIIKSNIVISEPFEGMPAQRNDVRAGDIILEVDGKSTKGLSVSDVSNMLKGSPKTTIKLKLMRYGEKKPIIKSFQREKIQKNSIEYSAIIAPKTGYILLSDFTDKSAIEVKLAINELLKKGNIEQLVFDIRNNGGGLISEAVKILGYFLPKGTEVLSLKGRNKIVQYNYKTPTEPIYPNMKLAILVNGYSASAAEILAGAIQDLDRGVVVGERTFGKGLVQNILPVANSGNVKVTTAKYYIPSGRCIQAIDYSHTDEDGKVSRVPDSLTHEFETRNGRIVRDGGGITPDIIITDNRKLNISYYILAQNLFFEFANEFVSKKTNIAKPSEFVVTDEIFNAFSKFLVKQKFTYETETQKYFKNLLEMAKYEGLDKNAEAELSALEAKFIPDLSKNLTENRQELSSLLGDELIKRYYFQKGRIEYSLRTDKTVETAIENLNNDSIFSNLLMIK